MSKLVVVSGIVAVSVLLGASALREPLASAAQSIQATITNLDRGGNIKVHEQGTAKVALTSEEVTVSRSVTNPLMCFIGDLSTVPAGKLFVIDYVNSHGSSAEATHFKGFLRVQPSVSLYLPYTSVFHDGVASERIHFAVPAGKTLAFFGISVGDADQGLGCSFESALGGHLQPA